MRVDPNRPVLPADIRRTGKAGGEGSGSFAEALGGEHASSVSTPSPIRAMGGLVALQEVEDATTRRRKAIQRGNRILDQLEDLRLGILSGTLDPASLAELASTAASAREDVEDEQLAQILDEIQLRAEVELAKLNFAGA